MNEKAIAGYSFTVRGFGLGNWTWATASWAKIDGVFDGLGALLRETEAPSDLCRAAKAGQRFDQTYLCGFRLTKARAPFSEI